MFKKQEACCGFEKQKKYSRIFAAFNFFNLEAASGLSFSNIHKKLTYLSIKVRKATKSSVQE